VIYNLGVWEILEEHAAEKAANKLPPQVAERYDFWASVVRQSGPQGLRAFKGFHDEKLTGKLAHLRSSRLNLQWRVLYSVDRNTVTVTVVRITPHDY
jgi:plasmid maintenance system killer protein